MSNPLILGVDTSNYRTSLCLLDTAGQVVSEVRELLTVRPHELGLRQSDAVFQHINRLPVLAEQMKWNGGRLAAVAVSTRPRPQADSYMPVFKAGESWARGIAWSHQIPCYETTHQEMHIAAGEYSAAARPSADRFLAVHLSGGTSELLCCSRTSAGYEIELLGGTLDLHAGQLIDRVGVALGLSFPAGEALEKLALACDTEEFRVPATARGFDFHLSGAEAQLLKAVADQTRTPAEIARAAEQCIAGSLEKVIRFAVSQGYPKEVLIVGGVAANRYIRQRLVKRLEHRAVGCSLFFANPVYSGDNAFGVAQLGLKHWINANI